MPLAASIQNRAKPSALRWRSGASKWGLSPFSSAEEEATLGFREVDEERRAGCELEGRLADEIEALAGAGARRGGGRVRVARRAGPRGGPTPPRSAIRPSTSSSTSSIARSRGQSSAAR